MPSRMGERCEECGGIWLVMVADFDHAITCSTQAERRAEVARLRAAGYGTPAAKTEPEGGDGIGSAGRTASRKRTSSGAGVVNLTDQQWDSVDASLRGPMFVEDDDTPCPCGNHDDGAMYRGRSIDERSDEIETGRERIFGRFA